MHKKDIEDDSKIGGPFIMIQRIFLVYNLYLLYSCKITIKTKFGILYPS